MWAIVVQGACVRVAIHSPCGVKRYGSFLPACAVDLASFAPGDLLTRWPRSSCRSTTWRPGGFICLSQTLVGAVKVYTRRVLCIISRRTLGPAAHEYFADIDNIFPVHRPEMSMPGSMLHFADPIVKERLDSRRLLPSTAWTRHSPVVYGWIVFCQALKDDSTNLAEAAGAAPATPGLCRVDDLANRCGYLTIRVASL